jgi:hypothetical protein
MERLSVIIRGVSAVTHEQEAIYSNRAFFAVYSALANDTDVIEVRIEAPDTLDRILMSFDIETALASTVELFVDTTKTDNATNRITSVNRNFNSSITSGVTLCHTPGGTQAGTANLLEYVGAATVSGKASAGGEASHDNHFVLKQGAAYLLRVTSRADTNALAILLDWYEEYDN